MARNEGNEVSGHMVGSMAPVMGQAVSNPLGVISAFVLLALVGLGIAIVGALRDTWYSWGPFAMVGVAFGSVYAGHRWLWGPAFAKRTSRRITAVALVLVMVVVEGCGGLVGVIVGRTFGFNPRAGLMDLGVPTPEGVRILIGKEREAAKRASDCREAIATGKLADGSRDAVTWAARCPSAPLLMRQDACGRLRPDQADDDTRYWCAKPMH